MPHSFPTRRSSDLARPAPPRGDDPPAGRTGGDIRQGSAREIAFLAKVADQDSCEVRVSPGGEHGDAVPGGPEHETGQPLLKPEADRSEEHTSELQSLMRISYAVFCLKKKKK